MKIVFDASTLRQSKKGSITAIVYFDFGSGCKFPDSGWSDFIVVIATWWKAAFDKVTRGRESADFRFMDGPYRISGVMSDKYAIQLRCIEDRRGQRVLHQALVGSDELKRELIGLAFSVSRECDAAGIESRDLDQLKKDLLDLRRSEIRIVSNR